MTLTLTAEQQTLDSKVLNAEALKRLAGCQGPCITVILPGHHPGAQEGSRRTILRQLIHGAEEQLAAGKHEEDTEALLQPLMAMADDPGFDAGGPAVAIFRSADTLNICRLTGSPSEKVVVASHFYLAPFVAEALGPEEFFILGLSKKHLRLFHCELGKCEERALPAAVPASLEEAGAYDKPDHDLENRSTAGASAGSMKAVQFGTSTDREGAGEYMHHFFGLVDRGLKDTLRGIPLLLAGVHEEVAAYRKAARYSGLLEGELHVNTEFLTVSEIAARAGGEAMVHYHRLGERVLNDFREKTDRSRTLPDDPPGDDVRSVVRAAAHGRVHRLRVRAETHVSGTMEPEFDKARVHVEDLLNAAVVETIRTGGEVFILPRDRMPVTRPVAAILRY